MHHSSGRFDPLPLQQTLPHALSEAQQGAAGFVSNMQTSPSLQQNPTAPGQATGQQSLLIMHSPEQRA